LFFELGVAFGTDVEKIHFGFGIEGSKTEFRKLGFTGFFFCHDRREQARGDVVVI
jgi:hypothetical protein